MSSTATTPDSADLPRAKITWERIRKDQGKMPVSHCPHCGENRIVFGWGQHQCVSCLKEYLQEYEADE